MKNIFIVNIHSFIDVITNSSTELFITDDKKTVEVVKKILLKMLDVSEFDSKGNSSNSKKVDEVFNVYEINDSNVDRLLETLECYGGPKSKNELIGKIIIEGVDDNCIPFDLFELIERTFNTQRFHLG